MYIFETICLSLPILGYGTKVRKACTSTLYGEQSCDGIFYMHTGTICYPHSISLGSPQLIWKCLRMPSIKKVEPCRTALVLWMEM